MASLAVEKKSCQCDCKRNEGGDCICACTAPCAFGAENQTVEWTCDCKCGDESCRCRFQLKCNRKAGDKCCSGGDSCGTSESVFTCKCRCSSAGEECKIRINKCNCCEVVRVEGGCCGGESSPVEAAASSGKPCCGGGAGAGGCC